MRVITFQELKPQTGIGYTREHLRRLVKAGKFPQPIELGDARIGWLESEIHAWLKSRADARTVA